VVVDCLGHVYVLLFANPHYTIDLK